MSTEKWITRIEAMKLMGIGDSQLSKLALAKKIKRRPVGKSFEYLISSIETYARTRPERIFPAWTKLRWRLGIKGEPGAPSPAPSKPTANQKKIAAANAALKDPVKHLVEHMRRVFPGAFSVEVNLQTGVINVAQIEVKQIKF